MGFGYTWEKLHTATLCLADEGLLALRLERALAVAAVLDKDEEAFPNVELRERWRKLVFTLTHGSRPDEWGAVLASLSDDDRQLAAHELIEIAFDVARIDVEDDLRRHRGLL